MAESEQDRVEPLSALPRRVWLTMLAVCAAFVLLPTLFMYARREIQTAPITPADRLVSPSEPGLRPAGRDAPHPATAPAPTESAEQIQRHAVIAAQRARLAAQTQQLRELWKQLRADADQLQTVLLELLTNDDGRRLAANGALMVRYEQIRDTQRATDIEIDGLGEELDALTGPLEGLEVETVSPDLHTALDALKSRIGGPGRQYADDLRKLQRIVAAAQSNTPAGQNLEQTLEIRDADQFERENEAIRAAREAALQRSEAEAAKLQEKIVAAEAELRRLGDGEHLDALKDRIAKAQEDRQAAAALAALKRGFDREWPAMQSLLQPFTSHGMTQPKQRTFVSADEEGPVSLGALRGTGALDPTVEGRTLLYGMTSQNNDRPLGAFPRYFGGAAEVRSKQALMKRVQDFLNKYGEIMIDKKLLAR